MTPHELVASISALQQQSTFHICWSFIATFKSSRLGSPPPRTSANYRAYGRVYLARLSFIRCARDLGFTLEAVRELLTLSDDEAQSWEAVDVIAQSHFTEIDRKIGDLTALRGELDRVLGSCRHGTMGDCKFRPFPESKSEWTGDMEGVVLRCVALGMSAMFAIPARSLIAAWDEYNARIPSKQFLVSRSRPSALPFRHR